MEVKSALMTTASTTDNTGAAIRPTPVARPGPARLRLRAGHAERAVDPGLVYDSTRSTGSASCAAAASSPRRQRRLRDVGSAIDPSDLNTPNIAIGALAGTQTVTRTVTNVANKGTYTASVRRRPATTVPVTPSTLQDQGGRARPPTR